MLDHVLKYGPWIVLGGGLLFFAYRFARFGFKGSMFSGKILRTFGEVPLSPLNGPSGVVRVHEIEGNGGSHVGIEIVQKSMLSYDMTPIAISRSDAAALVRMLGEALETLGMGSPEDTGGPS